MGFACKQWPSCALLLACCLLASCTAARAQAVRTVKDLKAAIYTDMPMDQGGDACIRLLTASGTVGCAAPGRQPVEGRLQRLDSLLPSADNYPDNAVFLLSSGLLADFLRQCQTNSALMERVRGVLVEPQPAPTFSQAATAPLEEYALYTEERDYAWNPTGTGINGMTFPFPIFLLDNATSYNALDRAAYNADQNMTGALNYARMQLEMEATDNSSACLQQQTCLPLGGHSVLATLPPLPPAHSTSSSSSSSSSDGMPAIWVLSQYDSTSLFHEVTMGADSPLSGLIAMLAAAELLGGAGPAVTARYRRRLVFAALAGEPWGLMGSKRLLWELEAGNSSMAGFSLANGSVAGVIEVTQVGRARQRGGGVNLYTHHHTSGSGSKHPPTEVLEALQAAAATASEAPVGINLSPASSAAPGLPPTSSAASFVRVGGGAAAVPAVLLSGFDATFRGSTFQSNYDTIDTVDVDSIASAAVVLARAAHELALGGGGAGSATSAQQVAASAPVLPVDYVAVRDTVEALMQCLLNSSVGLACPLASAMMTPVVRGHTTHYIGILRSLTADPQLPDASVKKDIERFIWNFLAFATAPTNSSSSSNGGSSSSRVGQASSRGSGDGELQRCQPLNLTSCPAGFACAGSRSIQGPDGLGFCLNTTMRYVPSYSTSLLYDSKQGWQLTPAARQWEQQHGWPADPIWTESNWPAGTPALRLYLKEAAGVETALLVAGILVAAASLAGTLLLRTAYHRKVKRL